MAVINKNLFLEFQKRPEWEGFTDLQKEFFYTFFAKRNVFLTGPAGTGKSYAVEKLFDFLDEVGHPYGKTATTGVAALNIGGTTIHSWSGMGLADDSGTDLLDKVSENKKACNRIRGAKLLVIDEISMAKCDLIEKIDIVCQFVRDSGAPFGGLQVVFVGDFLQLPPVFDRFESEKFAFDADAWKSSNVRTIHLTEIVRQHDDPTFASFLNKVRMGDDPDMTLLEPCINRVFPDDGIMPVRLFCKNYNVDSYNRDQLDGIESSSKMYYAVDDGPPNWKQFFDKNCRAPNPLELKVGAQVMLLANIDVPGGLVNGSVGVVKKMYTDTVEVQFANGTFPVTPFEWTLKQGEINVMGEMKRVKVASRKQIPLRLAWAVTIHKCLSEDSIIHLKNSSKRIGNVCDDDTYSVKNGHNTIVKIHTMNHHDALKINLHSGREIICSTDHKVAIADSLSSIAFTDAISIKEGDKVVCKKSFPTPDKSPISNNECWLLGALVGDGCYSENNIANSEYRIDFTNKPSECGRTYKKLIENLYGLSVGITKPKNNKSRTYYFGSRQVWEKLTSFGMIASKRQHKRVPNRVFECSRIGIASFICGLIDTDGHINKKNIVITNVAHKMLQDVQSLLSILGYRSFIAKMGKPTKTQNQAYQLQIYSYEARKFLSEFSKLLRANGKYKHLSRILAYPYRNTKVQINDLKLTDDEVGRFRSELRTVYGKDYGKTFRLHLPIDLGDYLSPGRRVTGLNRFILKRFVDEIPNFSSLGTMCKTINDSVKADIYFDTVTSIEPVFGQTLIDITLNQEHTYFADGVLHHNCQGSTLDRAEVDASEAFACGQVYVALSRVRNLSSLRLKKFNPSKVTVNKKCLDFYKRTEENRKELEQFFETEETPA